MAHEKENMEDKKGIGNSNINHNISNICIANKAENKTKEENKTKDLGSNLGIQKDNQNDAGSIIKIEDLPKGFNVKSRDYITFPKNTVCTIKNMAINKRIDAVHMQYSRYEKGGTYAI